MILANAVSPCVRQPEWILRRASASSSQNAFIIKWLHFWLARVHCAPCSCSDAMWVERRHPKNPYIIPFLVDWTLNNSYEPKTLKVKTCFAIYTSTIHTLALPFGAAHSYRIRQHQHQHQLTNVHIKCVHTTMENKRGYICGRSRHAGVRVSARLLFSVCCWKIPLKFTVT